MKFLLYPFSLIYNLITSMRNFFFHCGLFREKHYNLPIIGIGNLSVGGSGKTPQVEYLIRLLSEKHQIAILSRGYKRKTKGFVVANKNSKVVEIGDEALQIKNKFPNITVAVCESRRSGIEELIKNQRIELIILDDSFQHRWVKPGLKIMLSPFDRPFYKDFVLPCGYLRENRKGYKRANIIIHTKIPLDISMEKLNKMIQKTNAKEYQNIYFSSIAYLEIKAVSSCIQTKLSEETEIVFFSGIAKAEPALNHLKSKYHQIHHHTFTDHHQFTKKEIDQIIATYQQIENNNKILLTSEKDLMRIKDQPEIWKNLPLYYLPIEHHIINKQEKEYQQQILNYVQNRHI